MELPTGIELIEIDITSYLLETFYAAKIIKHKHGSFTIKLEDSENPSVPNNLINYRITGIINGSYVNGLHIEFYHDYTYTQGNELKMTKCSYQIDKIEYAILEMI